RILGFMPGQVAVGDYGQVAMSGQPVPDKAGATLTALDAHGKYADDPAAGRSFRLYLDNGEFSETYEVQLPATSTKTYVQIINDALKTATLISPKPQVSPPDNSGSGYPSALLKSLMVSETSGLLGGGKLQFMLPVSANAIKDADGKL